MKRNKKEILTSIHSVITYCLFTLILFAAACGGSGGNNSDDEEPTPDPPTISAISPLLGPVGTSVEVIGSGFSVENEENRITLNGEEMDVTSVGSGRLVFEVGEEATSGEVSVDVNGLIADGPEFTVVVEAITASGTAFSNSDAITTDSDGNYYVVGSFTDDITFEESTLSSAGNQDFFVAKFNEASELVWFKRGGGSGSDTAYDLTLDASGNVYVVANVKSGADYDGTSLNVSSNGVAVMMLNNNGELQWNVFATAGIGNAIELDGSGDLLITGSYSGTTSFGTTTLTSEGGEDAFIAKLNGGNGSEIWALSIGGTDDNSNTDIASNTSGDIFICGSIFGEITIGNTDLTSASGLDSYVAKFNSNGVFQWVTQISGSEGWNNTYSVGTDLSGDVYAAGYFEGSTDFGDEVTLNTIQYDGFIGKLDGENGNVDWVSTISGPNFQESRAIDVTDMGDVYVTGYFKGDSDFGNQILDSPDSGGDIFVARLSGDGSFQMVREAGSSDTDRGYGIKVDSQGIIHVTGFYRGSIGTFGITDLENPNNESFNDNAFVWKIWPE